MSLYLMPSPLIRFSMVSYPDLSRSTGRAVFFCLEGVSLFHCSRGLRSLFVYWDWALRGRIRRRFRLWGSFVNHLREIAGKSNVDNMNGKETSLQSNPN